MVAAKHRIASGAGGKVLTVKQAKAQGLEVKTQYFNSQGQSIGEKDALDENGKMKAGVTALNAIPKGSIPEGMRPQAEKSSSGAIAAKSKAGKPKTEAWAKALSSEQKQRLEGLNKSLSSATDKAEQSKIKRQIAGLKRSGDRRLAEAENQRYLAEVERNQKRLKSADKRQAKAKAKAKAKAESGTATPTATAPKAANQKQPVSVKTPTSRPNTKNVIKRPADTLNSTEKQRLSELNQALKMAAPQQRKEIQSKINGLNNTARSRFKKATKGSGGRGEDTPNSRIRTRQLNELNAQLKSTKDKKAKKRIQDRINQIQRPSAVAKSR